MKRLILILLLCSTTVIGTNANFAIVSSHSQKKGIDTRHIGYFNIQIDNVTNTIVDITTDEPGYIVNGFIYTSLTPDTPNPGTYKITGLKISYYDGSDNVQVRYVNPLYLSDN